MKHSKKGSRGPRLYFSHFQNRILCAFLLCTLIPIFIIGGISYAVSYNIAKDKILNASISADAQLHTQFDNRLQQVENIADTLQYNMYNLMQADAPMDTLAMLSEIRSNLSMFKTSFDLAYINIFLPDEHMASSESLYFFPMSKLSDFQIPKEVLENPGTSSVWFYQDLLSVPFLVNNSYHITNSVSCCRVLKHPDTDSIKYAYIIYLDASEFSSILQEIFQDNQITSYILTDNGKIVASNNPSLLSASLDEEKLDFLYNKGDSLKKRAHTNYHTTTLRNGWLQVTEIPDSYIMQNTHILIKSILLTILISLPLTILVVVLISKNLTRRIKTLSRAMETLQLDASDTNMKALVPQDRAPETFDEIDKLGITFEKMQHSLNDNLQSILELSLTEERLKYQLLQSQINPHFLYNILGSIQTCQSLGKLDIANQMLTNLTRFYRMTLRKSEDLKAHYGIIETYKPGVVNLELEVLKMKIIIIFIDLLMATVLFFVGRFFIKSRNTEISVLFLSGDYTGLNTEKICRVTGKRIKTWAMLFCLGGIIDFIKLGAGIIIVSVFFIILLVFHLVDMTINRDKYRV